MTEPLFHGLIPIVPEGWPKDEPLLLLKDVRILMDKREAAARDEGRQEAVRLDVERLFQWALMSPHLTCDMEDEPEGTTRWAHLARLSRPSDERVPESEEPR